MATLGAGAKDDAVMARMILSDVVRGSKAKEMEEEE